MGLKVSLSKVFNATFSDIAEAYIRIESCIVFPKLDYIRVNVAGYVNASSGYVMKEKEISEIKAMENFFYTRQLLIGGEISSIDRENFVPPQTIGEPVPIFREYYTIKMTDSERKIKPEFENVNINDSDTLYQIIYPLLKAQESRFVGAEDVLIDPPIEGAE